MAHSNLKNPFRPLQPTGPIICPGATERHEWLLFLLVASTNPPIGGGGGKKLLSQYSKPATVNNKTCKFIRILHGRSWEAAGHSSAGKEPTGKGPRREFRAITSAGQRHHTERAEKGLQGEKTGGGVQRTSVQWVERKWRKRRQG